jgi:hypothetical protein
MGTRPSQAGSYQTFAHLRKGHFFAKNHAKVRQANAHSYIKIQRFVFFAREVARVVGCSLCFHSHICFVYSKFDSSTLKLKQHETLHHVSFLSPHF